MKNLKAVCVLIALSCAAASVCVFAGQVGHRPEETLVGLPPVSEKNRAAFAFASALMHQGNLGANYKNFAPGYSGFGSVLPNQSDGSVDVYWQGTPPDEYDTLVTNAPKSLVIRLHRVKHSFAELSLAGERAMLLSNTPMIGFAEIVGADVLPDSSGIEIGVDSRLVAGLQSVARELADKLGVSVKLAYSDYAVALTN